MHGVDIVRVFHATCKTYAPKYKKYIKWNDPEIGISWPNKGGIVLSEKDSKCPLLKQAETNFKY